MRLARYLRGALQVPSREIVSRSRCPICCNTPSAFSAPLKSRAGDLVNTIRSTPFETRHQFSDRRPPLIVLDKLVTHGAQDFGRDADEKLIVTAWRT